jgi:hypothetical protein
MPSLRAARPGLPNIFFGNESLPVPTMPMNKLQVHPLQRGICMPARYGEPPNRRYLYCVLSQQTPCGLGLKSHSRRGRRSVPAYWRKGRVGAPPVAQRRLRLLRVRDVKSIGNFRRNATKYSSGTDINLGAFSRWENDAQCGMSDATFRLGPLVDPGFPVSASFPKGSSG